MDDTVQCPWIMSALYEEVLEKIPWRQCQKIPWNPWTLSTHSMDAMKNVQDAHRILGLSTDGWTLVSDPL